MVGTSNLPYVVSPPTNSAVRDPQMVLLWETPSTSVDFPVNQALHFSIKTCVKVSAFQWKILNFNDILYGFLLKKLFNKQELGFLPRTHTPIVSTRCYPWSYFLWTVESPRPFAPAWLAPDDSARWVRGCAFNGLSAFSLGVRLLCLPLEALPFLLPNLSSYLLLSYLLWLGNQVISLYFT